MSVIRQATGAGGREAAEDGKRRPEADMIVPDGQSELEQGPLGWKGPLWGVTFKPVNSGTARVPTD